jgi:hypothetical protein
LISIHRDTEHFGDERRYYKDFEPVDFGGDLGALAIAVSRYAWSPSQWGEGGRRRQTNFIRAHYCVLDYDGSLSLAQALRTFADCLHIIGTTRNHQKEKDGTPPQDRFRVLLKFERPIEDLMTFTANMRHWIGRFGADPACRDGARFYWPCVDIVSINSDGDVVEIVPPPVIENPGRRYEVVRRAQVIPAYLQPILNQGAPQGTRNATCFRLGAELTRCGFSSDRVFEIVESSPMSLPLDELRRAVANGIKAAEAERDRPN